jgi:hypothetical protein
MSKRFALPMLVLIVLLAAMPVTALASPAADPPTPEQCRRLYGTDEWTRRCRRLADHFDPIAYCRRIYGTDLWSRRCLHLQPDPVPEVRPRAIEPAGSAVELAPATRPLVEHP